MCGFPLMMDWLQDYKSDNHFGTYIMVDPLTRRAPNEFQSKVGTIILFREDKQEITKKELNYIWNFFAMLMNYTVYKQNENELIEFNR
jgi:hypothetical protein